MIDFYALSLEELTKWISSKGFEAFRAKQLFEWVYKKCVIDPDAMTNLSAPLKTALKEEMALQPLTFVRSTPSDDGETLKFLWRLADGKLVESVLIASGTRRTLCVSSQVGCPARCAFCASGQKGFFRNLSVGEIVAQLVFCNQVLKEKGERICHVVYMGMGEPLKNYEAVVQSVKQISKEETLGISQRRITVSTVGVLEGMKRLSGEELKVSLVLSLHAPSQHIRKKIIPYARQYDIVDIVDAAEEYARKTKRDTTYEYILIAGVNDQEAHAEELADLLKERRGTVNLIPYNPVPNVNLKRPKKEAIKAFRDVLYRRRIINTCRYTKGEDIAAACGQLALMESENAL